MVGMKGKRTGRPGCITLSGSNHAESRRRAELTADWARCCEEVAEMNRACVAQVVALLALGLSAHPSTAQQMWAPSGVPLCVNGCPGDIPRVIPDGLGGAFVAWRDIRNYSTNDVDVYLQRVTAMGLISPGWPVDGLPVAVLPNVQAPSGLAADGLGGALVAWEDWRNLSTTYIDPYVQRVLGDGSFPSGWILNGNPATRAAGQQSGPQVGPDGSGGAYVLWEDYRDSPTNGSDMYAQHLTASGAAAPGCPADGLPVCALPGNQGVICFVMPDDSGGAVFEWLDGRPGAPGGYALRVNADGTIAAGWSANGNRVGSGAGAAVRDEAGGFYLATSTPGPSPGFDGAYYVLRFTFAGALAPGWPAGGVLVCNAPGDRAGVTIDADGTGGAVLSWYDYRPPYIFTGGQIFAARVLSNGTLPPGWTVNGTLVSDPTSGIQSYSPFVAHDGQGGGYVVWQSQGGAGSPSTIQHLTGGGQVVAGWPQYGLRVAPSVGQLDTRIAADGQGGAIVAWDEGCCGRLGIWAQRFAPNGPTPTLLALVSAEAQDGCVHLDWFSAEAAALTATIYRRTVNSDWQSLGSVVGDGTGHLRYEDRAVATGVRYAYRLGYVEQGLERYSPETWSESRRSGSRSRACGPIPQWANWRSHSHCRAPHRPGCSCSMSPDACGLLARWARWERERTSST
jgi:hypothetical protein